jgi:hypothetical protein
LRYQQIRKAPADAGALSGTPCCQAHGQRCNRINYSFFFFVIFLSLFAMPSLAVMLAGADASEPDLVAAPPLVPLAPPVWANAALEKATAAAATGIKIVRIQASFVFGDG